MPLNVSLLCQNCSTYVSDPKIVGLLMYVSYLTLATIFIISGCCAMFLLSGKHYFRRYLKDGWQKGIQEVKEWRKR